MATIQLTGSSTSSGQILDVWTSYMFPHFNSSSGGSISIDLNPVPVNSATVSYLLKTLDLAGSASSVSGAVAEAPKVVPVPTNDTVVTYNLRSMMLEGSASSTSSAEGSLKQIAVPSNSAVTSYELVGDFAKVEFSVESRLHTNKYIDEVLFSGISAFDGTVYQQHKTSMVGSVTSGFTAKVSFAIKPKFSATSGGSIATLVGHKTKLEGSGKSSGIVMFGGNHRLIVEGSSESSLTANMYRDYQISLSGSSNSRWTGNVWWDHIWYEPLELEIWLERVREFLVELDIGMQKETQFEIDIDIPIVRLFHARVVYSKAKMLGDFHYPYNPPKNGFTGVRGKRLYSSVDTTAGKVRFMSKPVLSESRIIEQWEYMHRYFFEELRAMYEENNGNNTYSYRLEGQNKTYGVEIVSLTGSPYKDKYYRNVELILKPLTEQEL